MGFMAEASGMTGDAVLPQEADKEPENTEKFATSISGELIKKYLDPLDELTSKKRSGDLSDDLEEEFLRLYPEDEFDLLQEGLAEAASNDPNISQDGKSKVLKTFESSRLGREIDKIRNKEISAEEAERAIKVIEAFNGLDGELVAGVIMGLYDFQDKRGLDLTIPGKNSWKLRDTALQHQVNVANRIGDFDKKGEFKFTRYLRTSGNLIDREKKEVSLRISTKDKFLQVVSMVHDIVKYRNRDGRTTINELGLHEAASAIFTGDILRDTLNVDEVKKSLMAKLSVNEEEYSDYVNAIVDTSQIAVAGHGQAEFPHKLAKGGPVSEEKGLYRLTQGFQNAPIHKLYINSYRGIDKILNSGVRDEDKITLRRFVEGLRKADMVEGMDLVSFPKYLGESNISFLASKADVYQYLKTFRSTAFGYENDLPPGVMQEMDGKIEENRLRAGFLFALVENAVDGKTNTNLETTCKDALGEERAKEVLGLAKDLNYDFGLLRYFNGKEKQEVALALKSASSEDLSSLIDRIGEIDISLLRDGDLGQIVGSKVESLQEEVRKNKESLVFMETV